MKPGYFVAFFLVFLGIGILWAQEQLNVKSVVAVVETEPVPNEGDAADDPAIWIHPTNPAQSTIIGTDKQGGLAVYDLAGKELQYLAEGEFNNVDLRSGFQLGGQAITLVAASDETHNTLALFKVNSETRRLERLRLNIGTLGLSSPYGLCMYHGSSGYYVFVNGRKGKVEQWRLTNNQGTVTANMVRTFYLGAQVEGCVTDDELGVLYIGEEKKGIWKYGAEPNAGDKRTLVDDIENGNLYADVEGLTLYYGEGGDGYLIASSQGANEFMIYTREDNSYLTTFTITSSETIDHVSGTDGIDVTSANLGGAFSQGLFVAQDNGNGENNQNFKLVSWEAIAETIPHTSD